MEQRRIQHDTYSARKTPQCEPHRPVHIELLAKQKRFDVSCERTHPDQLELNLFKEVEVQATPVG
ncbi:hypothetical protein [Paenibacillus sp. RC67]|uniref:hypothetical protein n=1 Tax=Paenibacillus sp. RC67 TaxID=3039392 RepID=UPI0024ACD316|nr:hypothetical protein [Paenibacillus sp. RC67]